MPTRRRLLAAAGLAAASPGCMSVLGDDSTDEPADGGQSVGAAAGSSTVRLERLSLQNNHDSAHGVQLAVESGEGVLHMGSYELDPGSGTAVEGDWNSAAADYRVHARLDDREIQSADVTEGVSDDADCVRVLLRVDDQGNLSIWNGADCSR